MKNKILSVLILVILCTLGFQTYAKTKDEIVLKDGRVLKKPYIISKTPSGLNIGHEGGVIFIPFYKMSKERQKQYNYNPKESIKHKKRIAKAQRTRQVRIAKKRAQGPSADTGSFSYGPEAFPERPVSSQLQNELYELIREKARLEKERTDVSAGRLSPRSGPSDDIYISYRGGKVYRKKRTNYAKQTTKNINVKKRRLKEINSALQRNVRRTATVRNLIKRQTSKGIKKGRTVER